jgi:hypothetical protein
MEQQLRNLFIDKPFSAEGLNIQGFSIIDIGKGKVKKGKIFSNTDFVVDSDRLLKVLENKGKVYGYTKKGQLKALYVVTRDGHSLTCDEVYFSSDLNGEPVKNLMDQQVVFLMAQNASYYKDGKAVFQGNVVPKLTTKTGPYNWYMAISFALLYSFVFCTTLHSYLGIFSGIMMGLAMGSCFRSHKYEYEKPADEE